MGITTRHSTPRNEGGRLDSNVVGGWLLGGVVNPAGPKYVDYFVCDGIPNVPEPHSPKSRPNPVGDRLPAKINGRGSGGRGFPEEEGEGAKEEAVGLLIES